MWIDRCSSSAVSEMAALLPKTFIETARRQSLCAAVAAIQVCNYSQKIRYIKNPTIANLKRGTGGRSSFNGIVCTVFGSTGFYAESIVNQLGKIGTQVILPYRGDISDVFPLKVCGDLGQILFHPFHLRDDDSILRCIKHSHVVINLIGKESVTRNFNHYDCNVEGAARIARLCKQSGVERLIHVSHLNASPEPKPLLIPDGSKFLKSKWEGEWEVRKEFPEATIVRPADTYGPHDRYFTVYARNFRRQFHITYVYKKGEETVKQPVWIEDVAKGIMAIIKDPSTAGRTYQFVGPHRYKFSDLIRYIHENIYLGYKPELFPVGDLDKAKFYKRCINAFVDIWPNDPPGYFHMEALEKEATTDNFVEGVPTLEDLGIKPSPITDIAPFILSHFANDTSIVREIVPEPKHATESKPQFIYQAADL